MAVKIVIFVLASLLVATTGSSNAEEQASMESAIAAAPVVAPRRAPAPAPVTTPRRAPTPVPVTTPRRAPTPAPIPYIPPVDITACPRLCGGRCKLHSRPRHCSRVCITCCQRCKCVPPGTYGNKEMCGKCYTDMTTHGGRPKCP
ncbi:gibberellin-regulated protein 14-like [Aristolochia californica]|uniref:gibberellin-regulated protein 14-like n=1 Tax=Aristolochia californica TaxID=171875 RepID=UPI0035E2B63E